MLYFCTFRPEFEKKLLLYLKSTPSDFLKCKVKLKLNIKIWGQSSPIWVLLDQKLKKLLS